MKKIFLWFFTVFFFAQFCTAQNKISFDDTSIDELVKNVMNHQYGEHNYRKHLNCWLVTKKYNEKDFTYCVFPEENIDFVKVNDAKRVYFYSTNNQDIDSTGDNINSEVTSSMFFESSVPGILGLFILEQNDSDGKWRYISKKISYFGDMSICCWNIKNAKIVMVEKLNSKDLYGFLYTENIEDKEKFTGKYNLLIPYDGEYKNIFTIEDGYFISKKSDTQKENIIYRNDLVIENKEINGMFVIRIDTKETKTDKKISSCFFEFDLDESKYIKKNCIKD